MPETSSPTSGSTKSPVRRRVVLVKDGERWTFEWTTGDEPAVIRAAGDLARDDAVEFDWFDAAIVCRQCRSGGETITSPASSDQPS